MTFTGGSGSLSESSSWSLPICHLSQSRGQIKIVDWHRVRHTEKLVKVLDHTVSFRVSKMKSMLSRDSCASSLMAFAMWSDEPSKRFAWTFCPPSQAPPKKALLSREQFEEGRWDSRDGQVPTN
jgi:hypothetical protein